MLQSNHSDRKTLKLPKLLNRTFKRLIIGPPEKKGHLQSHSSWCVTVNWEFRKGAINGSRSWQIGMVVITLKFASIRERYLTHTRGTLCPVDLVETIAGQLIVLSE